jgi:cation:H+ antiporter
MEILIWVALFIVSLVILLKSSSYFTEAAEKIGIRLGIPAFIVGVTIVAIGTSLPELISSLFAVYANSSEIVIGNVVGSNIANILLVLGVIAIISKKMKTGYEILKVDLPVFFASALFVVVTCFDGNFTLFEGIIGLACVLTYLAFAATNSHKKNKNQKKQISEEKKELKKQGIKLQILILFISGIFIFVGAKYTIDSVVKLSELFNIAKELIAVTAIALGTSLPELFVGIQAARRGNAGMALGNVLGSNIFNSFAVLGFASIFGTLIVPRSIVLFSIPVMIGASLLYFFIAQDRELSMWEGIILILFYILYVGKLFIG